MTPAKRVASPGGSDTAELTAFALLAVAIAAVIVNTHLAASLTFPSPSGDEAFFTWQAHAFQRSNSFIAPEIDPTRPILLLPFVYSATLGLVFKVFGSSMEIARNASVAFTLIGFTFLAVLVRRHAVPAAALLVIGAFLLNEHFVVMANEIRMESLFFAFVCGALLLVQCGRIWLALGVLSVSPMVHPNGVFYLGGVVAYLWLTGAFRGQRPGRGAIAVFVVAALVWLAHGLYVLKYWDGFLHDTSHRIGETAQGHPLFAQLTLGGAFGLVLIVATAGLGAWRKAHVGGLLVFAAAAWLHCHLRIEAPYDVFGDFSYLLTSLALVEIAAGFAPLAASGAARMLRPLAGGIVAVGLLGVYFKTGRVEGPFGYLRDLRHQGMRIEKPGAYFNDEDRKALRAIIAAVEPNRPITVETYPWSESSLIADMNDARVQYLVPYFDPMFRPASQWVWGYGPTQGALADLYIVRVSRLTPQYLHYRPDSMFARASRRPEIDQPALAYSRDSTEKWYVMRGHPTAK
jgi:hypothetical protein